LACSWAESANKYVKNQNNNDISTSEILSMAFPERVAKARGKSGEFVMRNGRGVYVEAHDGLAKEPYLAIGDLGGGAGKDRILLAAPMSEEAVFARFKDEIEIVEAVIETNGVVRGLSQHRLGALVLKEVPLKTLSPTLRLKIEADAIAKKGLAALNCNEAFYNLCARVEFLRHEDDTWPNFSAPYLLSTIDNWLVPFADEKGLMAMSADTVFQALRAQLTHNQLNALEALAPTHLKLPTGNRVSIDYGAQGGPQAAMRVQELYGTKTHPAVGKNKTPLALALLSPAHRPIQITKDIVAFWAGSWKDVKSEMKGRYPRHLWPDDPSAAQATARAKPRGT
jgi:ATP-dependent helicase HrpB